MTLLINIIRTPYLIDAVDLPLVSSTPLFLLKVSPPTWGF